MATVATSRTIVGPHGIKLSLLVALIVGVYAATSWVNLSQILDAESIGAQLKAAGPFGPIVFMLLMAMAVVISPIPSLPLDLAAGATFGTVLGATYAVIGAEIGAVVSFLIGRALGRDALTRLFRANVNFCERCSDRHLAIFILLARLVPLFSFDIISYGAGLTNMSLRTFALATFVGMIPPTFMLTYAGSQVVSGPWLLILSGLAMVAVLLLFPRLVLRYPTARWVRLLRGEMPVPVVRSSDKTAIHPPCSSCGGPLH